MEESKAKFSDRTEKFLEKYSKCLADAKKYQTKEQSDRIIDAALLYEKIRVALEYQEDHLVFKNAIARILKRRYTLSPNLSEKRLTSDLVSELAWANYVNPETLGDTVWKNIEGIVRKYIIFLQNAKSNQFVKNELQSIIINLCACEIEELILPKEENDVLVDFTYEVLRKTLDTQELISEAENEIQLKIAIYYLLLKPDLHLIQYWLLKKFYPKWTSYSEEEVKNFAKSFDPYFNQIDKSLKHHRRFRYLQFTKKYIGPFRVLKAALISNNFTLDILRSQPGRLITASMETYNSMVAETKKRVWRGVIRALIFLLVTKISLAFLLEVPFDRMFMGGVNYLTLGINVTLPPLLMFIAGSFIHAPSKKNYHVVRDSLMNILYDNKIEDKEFRLEEEKAPSYGLFNLIYSIVTLAILYGSIRLLLALDFNFFSILLFFIFVSAVSFFSFRIRNFAQELIVRRTRDNTLTSVVELIFLPFIRIGRYISNQLSYFNPFILVLDFLIEAPLKTIIRIANSWKRFINKKKEELEY